MTESDLCCNISKCRKTLTHNAWVTSCSHAFCLEDGKRVFETGNKCPACNSELTKHYDIVKVNLNPSEEFKSMVLAGLRPEIALDVASRSVTFWGYQITQEKLHHVNLAKHARDRFTEMESSFQTMMVKTKNDRAADKKKLEAIEAELLSNVKKVKELEERLNEKNRQMQNIQSKYESLRRNMLPISVSSETERNIYSGQAENLQFIHQEEMIETHNGANHAHHSRNFPQKNIEFDFRPRGSPAAGNKEVADNYRSPPLATFSFN